MSDKTKAERPEWGTIFSQGREHTLKGLENQRSTAWTDKDEAEYMERVRAKAGQMATAILDQARNEARGIETEAKRRGYDAGIEEAKKELESFRNLMSDSVAAVLSALEGQCSHIFDQWRADILAVAKLAIEKVTAVELSERRRDILEALFVDSVALMETRHELVIKTNPEDEPIIDDIIKVTKDRYEDVRSWRVRGDASISPGSIVVESESSLADGRVESRIAAVEQVLATLVLPDRLDGEPESCPLHPEAPEAPEPPISEDAS